MAKKFFITVVVLAAVAFGAWYLFGRHAAPGGAQGRSDISLPQPASSTDVIIETPLPDTVVRSPLSVSGEAKGGWFFEANIPVVLKDQNGNVIGQAGGTAGSDWTTTSFVPFTATLDFQNPGTPYGTLEIQKDNPSGAAENAGSFSLPVRFDLAAYQVQVFWGSRHLNPDEGDCTKVFPGLREIPATTTIAGATLDQLLAGPTAGEKRATYFTEIPDGVKVQSLTIQDGVARVDFSSALSSVAGSCAVQTVRAQIVHTLEQFPTVTSVVISVNGGTDSALQP